MKNFLIRKLCANRNPYYQHRSTCKGQKYQQELFVTKSENRMKIWKDRKKETQRKKLNKLYGAMWPLKSVEQWNTSAKMPPQSRLKQNHLNPQSARFFQKCIWPNQLYAVRCAANTQIDADIVHNMTKIITHSSDLASASASEMFRNNGCSEARKSRFVVRVAMCISTYNVRHSFAYEYFD